MDELAAKPAKDGKKKRRGAAFKSGFDPRRWMKGRGRKTPEQKEGEQILLAVLLDELSREFDTATMQPLEKPETIDALRLMVRTWIKKQPDKVVERIAGKVTDNVDITSGGEPFAKMLEKDHEPHRPDRFDQVGSNPVSPLHLSFHPKPFSSPSNPGSNVT